MKEHDATEMAYKNGYKQGVQDILGDVEGFLYMNFRFCKEEIGNALAVICKHNNITMDQLKEQYDAALEQAVTNMNIA